jgi:acetyltransferase
VFGTSGPREMLDLGRRVLGAMGVPQYPTPEQAARAMCALVDDANARARREQTLVAPTLASVPALPEQPLDEHLSKGLLDALGVATPTRRACLDRREAHAAFAELGAPVVAKALDAAIAHKAAAGGVHLGIETPAQLDTALDALDALRCDRYLIERQLPPGVELLVGGVRDPVWGPVIAFGRGGRDAESHRPAWRLAPLSEIDIVELVREADPAIDVEAVAPAIRAVAALLVSHPEITEIDVNPLGLGSGGAVALDALVVRETEEA